jgi:hypothetical protein
MIPTTGTTTFGEAMEELRARRNARVHSRAPLYQAALAQLRTATLLGQDPAKCWVAAFAPLNAAERVEVRRAFAEQLARHSKAGAEVVDAVKGQR